MRVLSGRVRCLRTSSTSEGPIVYWMQRDQRAHDNWALLFAQDLALKYNRKLVVIFCVVPNFLSATFRQYDFLLKGLQEVEHSLKKKHIPFYLLSGEPQKRIAAFLRNIEASIMVSDFNPLRINRIWKKELLKQTDITYHSVDTHNIVPCWLASEKEEFAAYTIRPKINRLLEKYLEPFPNLEVMPKENYSQPNNNWEKIKQSLQIDYSVLPVPYFIPGEKAGREALTNFLNNRLAGYASKRNNPTLNAVSELSPYFHFGQLAPQRAALEAQHFAVHTESQKAFLEELIIRRELADNYCFYNPNYDSFEGLRPWAKETLNNHRTDKREHLYSLEEFEQSSTSDQLWNAAQSEMVKLGKMHGYMRMYWAKKILEWTSSPEEAFEIAIYLNDKYSLDGRDPNGYTGISWSLGGIHDRAWGERPVFGKIRYMNYNGCKRKFNIEEYITKVGLI